jgi:small subunit ribosomal protein S2
MGGMLTNFEVVKRQLKRMAELVEMRESGALAGMSKKEQRRREDELERLERNFGGIVNMKRLPAAVFVVDPHKERLAVTEARKLEIPIIAITDTNCDPEEISWIIPGNDDAIRSVRLIATRLVDGVMTGLDEHQKIEQAQAQKAEAERQVQAEEARIAAEKAEAEAQAEAARLEEEAAKAVPEEASEAPAVEEAPEAAEEATV